MLTILIAPAIIGTYLLFILQILSPQTTAEPSLYIVNFNYAHKVHKKVQAKLWVQYISIYHVLSRLVMALKYLCAEVSCDFLWNGFYLFKSNHLLGISVISIKRFVDCDGHSYDLQYDLDYKILYRYRNQTGFLWEIGHLYPPTHRSTIPEVFIIFIFHYNI